MVKLFRSPFVRKWFLLSLVWAIGLCFVGWATPVGPRLSFELNGAFLGFLKDDRTALIYHSNHDSRTGQKLSLCNLERGERLSYVPLEVKKQFEVNQWVFDRINFIKGSDLLLYATRQGGDGRDEPQSYALHVFEIPSGRLVATVSVNSPFQQLNYYNCQNGTRVAVVCQSASQQLSIQVYSIPELQLVQSFPLSGPESEELNYVSLCFSPDGNFLAIAAVWQPVGKSGPLTKPLAYDLFDVSRGHKLHTSQTVSPYGWVFFSPDGNTVVDDQGVWDVRKGAKRFARPSRIFVFSPDSRYLILLSHDEKSWWLAYCSASTGEEILERRIALPFSHGGGFSLRLLDDSIIVAEKVKSQMKVPWYLEWLARLPGFGGVVTMPSEHVMIDYSTGKTLHYGPDSVSFIAPDHSSYFVSNQNQLECWDIPSRRPWISLLLSWTVWSLIFWLIQNRIFMILRMTKTKVNDG